MPRSPQAGCTEPLCPNRATYRGKCEDHKGLIEKRRGSRSTRGYDDTWLRSVEQAIREQPWCSDCGATEELTGDHPIPLAQGGDPHQEPKVLCRSCNSSKGKGRWTC